MAQCLVCVTCHHPIGLKENVVLERHATLTSNVYEYSLDLDVFELTCPCYSATNPTDTRFDVVKFAGSEMAPRFLVDGNASAEFSWFPPFNWQYAGCTICGEHLGWAFSEQGCESTSFYGLIITRLRPEFIQQERLSTMADFLAGFVSARLLRQFNASIEDNETTP